jgi:GNAT superfamily N-acetyltransferase
VTVARLEASGMSRSQAIRAALVAAADRLSRRRELAAEVAALEADEVDGDEMLAVASLMSMTPWRSSSTCAEHLPSARMGGEGWVVRPAVDRDLLGVVRLLERVPELGAGGLTPRQRAAWRDMLAAPLLTVYVAVAPGAAGGDDEVAGTVAAQVIPNLGYDCHPSAVVEAMVVAPGHRRHGVGRLLMDRVLADLRAASCRKVQLLSHKRHAADGAHDFYRSLGFEPEAEGFRLYLET